MSRVPGTVPRNLDIRPMNSETSAIQMNSTTRLLGRKGLETEASPPVGQAIIESSVGYHIREGGHSIEMFDWRTFMDFADHHLKR